MVSGLGGNGTNQYGQPHYQNYQQAQEALNNGQLTYGSSFTGVNGTTGYVYSVAPSPSGQHYPVANNEAFFNDLCGGNGNVNNGANDIGKIFCVPNGVNFDGYYGLR